MSAKTIKGLAGATLQLAEAVKRRRTREAVALIDKWIGQLDKLPLTEKGVIPLIAYSAWGIDYYGPHLVPVENAVARFSDLPLGEVGLCDLALMNIAAGLVKFHREQYDDAKALFEQVKEDADRGGCTELMIVSRYYLGRVLWKQGDIDRALEYIRNASSRDLHANDNQPRVAAMELVEGWLLFLKGMIRQAQEVLDRAEKRLCKNEDYLVDLGNIKSFKGRLFREDGEYQKALSCYAEAIEIYGKHDRGHRNVARVYLNQAFVLRLLARDLDRTPVSAAMRDQTEAEVEELRGKAFHALKQAREIFEFDKSRHTRGLGKLHNNLALLFFDKCEFDEAEKEAAEAFALGKSKGDKNVMADARIIQSTVALEGGQGLGAPRAFKLAKEAVDLAEQTNHRRLRARAYIREGLALLESPYNDPVGAERLLGLAQNNLVEEDRDYLRHSLAVLEKGIQSKKRRFGSFVSCMTIADLERHCLDKDSLQEISAERDEEIIRFVFERCERNIDKTARELKTGQKKVRRATLIFKISQAVLDSLEREEIGAEVMGKLATLKNREIQGRARFLGLLKKNLGTHHFTTLESKILKHMNPRPPESFWRG